MDGIESEAKHYALPVGHMILRVVNQFDESSCRVVVSRIRLEAVDLGPTERGINMARGRARSSDGVKNYSKNISHQQASSTRRQGVVTVAVRLETGPKNQQSTEKAMRVFSEDKSFEISAPGAEMMLAQISKLNPCTNSSANLNRHHLEYHVDVIIWCIASQQVLEHDRMRSRGHSSAPMLVTPIIMNVKNCPADTIWRIPSSLREDGVPRLSVRSAVFVLSGNLLGDKRYDPLPGAPRVDEERCAQSFVNIQAEESPPSRGDSLALSQNTGADADLWTRAGYIGDIGGLGRPGAWGSGGSAGS
eukprot:gene9470-biopygen2829